MGGDAGWRPGEVVNYGVDVVVAWSVKGWSPAASAPSDHPEEKRNNQFLTFIIQFVGNLVLNVMCINTQVKYKFLNQTLNE